MALYSYKAFTSDGKKVSGTVDSVSVQSVREQLLKQNLFPTEIALALKESPKASFFQNFFANRISLKEKIFFTKQLAVLLHAGVPLLDALELLFEQSEKKLKTIISTLKDDIREGSSLADSLLKYPKIFDITYVQLVRAGEASGGLENILDRLKDYLEESQNLRKKIKSAMMMPLIQLGIVALVVVGLLTAVVPKIAQAFSGQGVALPLPTRMLMSLSDMLLNHYLAILIFVAICAAAFLWWRSTASGSKMLDSLMLKIPFIGYFARMRAIVQFCRTLGILLEAGVNLPESLSIVCKVVDNKTLTDTLNEARENIIKQGNITDYLRKTELFPSVAIYLINTGEKSGKLDSMLLTVAQYYEEELRDFVTTFASILNAAMPLVMGLIVGFIVLSIALPIMNLGTLVEKG